MAHHHHGTNGKGKMEQLNIHKCPAPPKPPIPSEVLYMFLGWLTSRDESVQFGKFHDSSRAIDLIEAFCRENNLDPPREGWEKNLSHPSSS